MHRYHTLNTMFKPISQMYCSTLISKFFSVANVRLEFFFFNIFPRFNWAALQNYNSEMGLEDVFAHTIMSNE